MTDNVLSREFFKFGLEIITDHEGNILNLHIILPQSEYYRVFHSEMRETKALDEHLKLNFHP